MLNNPIELNNYLSSGTVKGMIITHYPELLDEYDRNDSIFIIRNREGITVENLSTILKRNDIKKSDAYQSGFMEGTIPMDEAYMRLKKSMAAALRRRPMELAKYKACICEVSAENAIIDMLQEEVIRCRDGRRKGIQHCEGLFLRSSCVVDNDQEIP